MKKILLVALLLFSLDTMAQRNNIIFAPKSFADWFEKTVPAYGFQSVDTPSRWPGRPAYKITLKKGGPENRSELGTDRNTMPKDVRVGFSFYVPDDYVLDAQDQAISQFQAYPDAGEGFGNPPFLFYTRNGRLYIDTRYDAKAFNKTKVMAVDKHYDVGALAKGKWIDVVFRIKWSFQADGILEAYIDNKQVLAVTGPIGYNDKANPYFKMGIYEYNITQSAVDTRSIYFDPPRLGNDKATYNDVYPGKIIIKKQQVTKYSDGTQDIITIPIN